MAEESIGRAENPPPPSEEIHLPAPSYLPVVVALGVTLAVVGVVLSWILCGVGVLITVVCVVRWIRETREDMASLPLEQ